MALVYGHIYPLDYVVPNILLNLWVIYMKRDTGNFT